MDETTWDPRVVMSCCELAALAHSHLLEAHRLTKSAKAQRHIREAGKIIEAIRKWAADPATDNGGGGVPPEEMPPGSPTIIGGK